MRLGIPVVLSVAFAVGLFSSASATAANVTGTWKSEFTTQNGDKFETTYKLKQDGDKLTGVVIGRNNNETEPERQLTERVVRHLSTNTTEERRQTL